MRGGIGRGEGWGWGGGDVSESIVEFDIVSWIKH